MNVDFSTALSAVIKKHRESQKMSLAALAKKAGLTQTYPGALEKGLYSPSVDVAYSLAKAVGVPFSTLVKEAEKLLKTKSS